MMGNVVVRDRLVEGREVTIDSDSVGVVVNLWVREDGGASKNVGRLVAALRRGDWVRVHELADYLSLDVDAAAGVL